MCCGASCGFHGAASVVSHGKILMFLLKGLALNDLAKEISQKVRWSRIRNSKVVVVIALQQYVPVFVFFWWLLAWLGFDNQGNCPCLTWLLVVSTPKWRFPDVKTWGPRMRHWDMPRMQRLPGRMLVSTSMRTDNLCLEHDRDPDSWSWLSWWLMIDDYSHSLYSLHQYTVVDDWWMIDERWWLMMMTDDNDWW